MQAFKKIIYRWISQRYMKGCSNYNSLSVRKSCRSKKQAREVFARHEIPHARGEVFFNPFRAIRFAKQHGFPLVVKPNVSGFSRGSHFPIQNYSQLWKAIALARLWWPTSVVEEYLEGANFRILVAQGEIISVLQRYQPYVTGNGKDSISALIDQENAIRKEMGLHPCIYPLQKNSSTRRFLRRQQLSLESVPPAGQQVLLFYRISLAPGGIVETIDKSTLHPENAALFKKILTLFDANILGIDAIFEKGLSTDYREQDCIFLEVNSRPYLAMHDHPRYGPREDLSVYLQALDQLDIRQADVF